MNIIENAKEAVKLVQQIDNIELYKKILDVQSDGLEIMEQLKEKIEKIDILEKALEFKGKLVVRGSAYFLTNDSDEIIDGPFCTKCFDIDHKKCRIIPRGRIDHSEVQCLKCKVVFNSRPVQRFLMQQHSLE